MRHRVVGFIVHGFLIVLLPCTGAWGQGLSTAQVNGMLALNSPNFGLTTSAGDPRITQLALKYMF